MNHLELQRGRQPKEYSDQSFSNQQLIGFALGSDRRDVIGRTRGAVDQAKQGIGALAVFEPIVNARRADGPSILWLMTGETGTPIGAQVLEECVVRRRRATAGLEGRDLATRIFVRKEPGDGVWRRLRTMIGILELTHL
jgi:hypothetical protein